MSELQARALLETALSNIIEVASAVGLNGLKLDHNSRAGVFNTQTTWGIVLDAIDYLNEIKKDMV